MSESVLYYFYGFSLMVYFIWLFKFTFNCDLIFTKATNIPV